MNGWQVFLLALTPFFGIQIIPLWIANPLFWYGIYHFLKGDFDRSRNGSMAAVLAGSIPIITMVCGGQPEQLRIGCWLWLGSSGLLAFCSFLASGYRDCWHGQVQRDRLI